MSLKLIRRLALFVGLFCIVGETVRRWHTWTEWPPDFFDDYLIGLFLFYGAWRSARDERRGHHYLAAAWGFACGLGYASFFGHLRQARGRCRGHVWKTNRSGGRQRFSRSRVGGRACARGL